MLAAKAQGSAAASKTDKPLWGKMNTLLDAMAL
jgi:hypothetical protein